MTGQPAAEFVAYALLSAPPAELLVFSDPSPELVHRVDLTGDEDAADVRGILIDLGFVCSPASERPGGLVFRAIR